MRTDLFDYELPDSLIARHPTAARDGARLIIVRQEANEHHWVRRWPELLEPGALVVLNQTRVFNARLRGHKEPGGGSVELFLLRPQCSIAGPANEAVWEAFGRSNRPLRSGTVVRCGEIQATVLKKEADGHLLVALAAPRELYDAIDQVGEVPIPPYLHRLPCASDRERYQTVYASEKGSVAAPTAGLHLTSEMLKAIRMAGASVVAITLHVGAGTFRPIQAETLEAHTMHSEHFRVTDEVAHAIEETRRRGNSVVAVGTTVVRALESASDPERPGLVRAMEGETQLMLRPGSPIRVVDALLTNFHQPRSTLLALVAAFIGRERMLGAYDEAKRHGYRFLSYGDAMWIPKILPHGSET